MLWINEVTRVPGVFCCLGFLERLPPGLIQVRVVSLQVCQLTLTLYPAFLHHHNLHKTKYHLRNSESRWGPYGIILTELGLKPKTWTYDVLYLAEDLPCERSWGTAVDVWRGWRTSSCAAVSSARPPRTRGDQRGRPAPTTGHPGANRSRIYNMKSVRSVFIAKSKSKDKCPFIHTKFAQPKKKMWSCSDAIIFITLGWPSYGALDCVPT